MHQAKNNDRSSKNLPVQPGLDHGLCPPKLELLSFWCCLFQLFLNFKLPMTLKHICSLSYNNTRDYHTCAGSMHGYGVGYLKKTLVTLFLSPVSCQKYLKIRELWIPYSILELYGLVLCFEMAKTRQTSQPRPIQPLLCPVTDIYQKWTFCKHILGCSAFCTRICP